MCGRYKVSTKAPQIIAAFDVADVAPVYAAGVKERFNVAPTDEVPVVRTSSGGDGKRALTPMRWGLIPFWAKDAKVGSSMINARVETVPSKPAFREALEKRRCLVISDGFYEWQKTSVPQPPGPTGRARKPIVEKQPWLFRFEDGHVFAYAGLWAKWKGGHGTVESCSILTGPPNELVAPFHDRMPVVLDPVLDRELIAQWLDVTAPVAPETLAMLTSGRALPGFIGHPVDKRVGNVKNDDPSLAERVDLTVAV